MRTHGADLVAHFSVGEGDRVPVAAVWRSSHRAAPAPPPASALVEQTDNWWRSWVAGLRGVDAGAGEWQDAVIRSLITLKALSFAPTGGLVAAPTTSLPQQASGMRNWDYRYCWIRDAADAVDVFLSAGADQEAASLLDWLGHAVEGPPAQVQPVYRVAGERRMPELEAHWLPGYENAQPVRIGNAAAGLPQLGTFGDVLRARLSVRAAGLPPAMNAPGPGDPDASEAILAFLESRWLEPDAGIWETRGLARQFVHTKAMIWTAADSAVKMIEAFGDRGPAGRWRRLRAAVHGDVLERGYDPDRNTFTQCYGSAAMDASLLRLPLLGFLEAADPRMTGTIEAVTRELDDSGVLLRYQARHRPPTPMACRLARRDTCPPRSGWRRCSPRRATWSRRSASTRRCSGCATTWDCWPRAMTRCAGGSRATIRWPALHIGLIMTARASHPERALRPVWVMCREPGRGHPGCWPPRPAPDNPGLEAVGAHTVREA